MAITLVQQNGVAIPMIVCDVCGRQIEKASDGFVLWDYEATQFIHKIRCDSRKLPMSMALNVFLSRMLFNSKFDAVEAEKETTALEEFGP